MPFLRALALMACLTLHAHAQPLQPVPPLTARVIDTSGTLLPAQMASLEASLAALEQDKGSQVVVLMVPSTAPEDIAAYANRVGNSWKIGRREVGDGLILLVAVKDRRLRIEVAKALEGAVPDIAADRIIRDAIMPFFREGDFAGGLEAGVQQIAARIRGEALPPVALPQRAQGQTNALKWQDMSILLLLVVPVVTRLARRVFGRKLGALLTGAGMGGLIFLLTVSVAQAVGVGLLALVYALFASALVALPQGRSRGDRSDTSAPSSDGRWKAGRSGFDGGGFRSGGGGNFGGGGASGRW